jgi:FMN phosphatase YigB (HAD superfamily)
MPLTLEQYANYLDTRELPWPEAPKIDPPKARPHLVRLRNLRAVTWNAYGTLLAITGGELYFEHPKQFMMDVALDKTIQEFKMWQAMTRTSGQPVDYLRPVYENLLKDQRMVPEKHDNFPEVRSDVLWDKLFRKLMKKEYRFDAGFYGSLNEFSKKVAYFFHASLQGTACYPGAAAALQLVKSAGLAQGILGDGQCFTLIQVQRGLKQQDAAVELGAVLDADLCTLSHEVKVRLPSKRLWQRAVEALEQKGIAPEEVLHIGSRIALDVVPARKLGMKTGLFAGDKASLQATAAQCHDRASRPDVLLTELSQIDEIIRSP